MDKGRRQMSTADFARAEAADQAAVAERERIEHERVPARAAGQTIADAPAPPRPVEEGNRAVLFADNEAQQFRARWTEIQAAFVDSPRAAVERADTLVADTMKRMAEVFAAERANMESQWDRGDQVTTEDLRVALQRYRAFFDRLLNV